MPYRPKAKPSEFEPMLAQLADAPLQDPSLVYEPKYDGVRIVARVGSETTLTSRLGNDKTAQFPEVAEALRRWSRRLKVPMVVDGEVVALDAEGRPLGFQHLQGRIHLGGRGPRGRSQRLAPEAPLTPVAYLLFDLLAEGLTDLRGRPLTERRARLEALMSKRPKPDDGILRLSEQVRGDGRALHARVKKEHGEGVIAKRAASVYHSGRGTPDWRKLKIVQDQEFVIGGWTDPRGARSNFGALLLGVPGSISHGAGAPPPARSDADASLSARHGRRRSARTQSPTSSLESVTLTYAGSVGTGFDERELNRLMKRLLPLETTECPFIEKPATAERARWVKPTLVAQVRFTEWTTDNKLRHPVYLGLRDDKDPRDVVIEHQGGGSQRTRPTASETGESERAALIEQLQVLEDNRRDGTLVLPDGTHLAVTNLHKVFWPSQKLTKGDLFRYYVKVAHLIQPAVADRPLVMKRHPNGIQGKPFYQHQVAKTPQGVRVERVGDEQRPQLIGGGLATLLYMTQLAAISQDPWFSRVPDVEYAECAAIDLDPPDRTPFSRVLEVALWVRDELARLGAIGVPKTSGAQGLHVYVRLPPRTPFEAGLIFCQIVATLVATRHPKHATTERAVRARGTRIYVDCLQNIEGKTLATAYSARASEWAGVSTPLTWQEVERGVDREDFTIQSVPSRFAEEGDLWATLRDAPPVDLERAARRTQAKPRRQADL